MKSIKTVLFTLFIAFTLIILVFAIDEAVNTQYLHPGVDLWFLSR